MGFFTRRARYPVSRRGHVAELVEPPFPLVVPYVVPLPRSLFAQTDTTALAITQVRVYRSHLIVPLLVRLRDFEGLDLAGLRGVSTFWLGRWVTHNLVNDPTVRDERFTPGLIPESPPPEVLRFGVQFGDGRSATNLDEWPPAAERQVTGPVLSQTGFSGRGAGRSCEVEYKVTPLPSAGQVTFFCEWPARDIPESTLAIDGGSILDAAEQAITAWDSDSSAGGEDR